jgi:hypothetical protein
MDINLPTCTCLRCGKQWIPRTSPPALCPNPKCHSPYWSKPKVIKNVINIVQEVRNEEKVL